MSFSSTVIVAGPYARNGATTIFPFGFLALSAAEVEVVSLDANDNATALTGYVVHNVGVEGMGFVQFAAPPPASADQLYVRARPHLYQDTNLLDQNTYNPENIQSALDRLAQSVLWTLNSAGGVPAEWRGMSVSVDQYGARGDGVALDGPAIQRAIDAVGALGGGEVVFPTGTYLIAAPIKLRPDVTLRRAPGAIPVVRQADAANAPQLVELATYNAHRARIEGITFDGNHLNNSRSMATERFAVSVWNADDVVVRGCTVSNYTGHGVFVKDGMRALIEDNAFHDLAFYGVFVNRTALGARNAPVIQRNSFARVAWHQIVVARTTGARIRENDVVATSVVGQVVSVAGATVTWVSGPDFAALEPGNFLIFNGGTEALIVAKLSPTQLTLSAAPGDVANKPAASGAADLITSWGSADTLIERNRTTGGASLAVSLFGDAAIGSDVGARVENNQIAASGSAGISVQTTGGNTVSRALIAGNFIIGCGVNGAASDGTFNSGIAVSGTISDIRIIDNDLIDGGSGMHGLNLLTAGVEVRVSGNRHAVTEGGITNGASVALSAGWNGAAVSELTVLDRVISFLVTTTALAPTANPNVALTHRCVPTEGKRATAEIVNSSAVVVPLVMFYPEPATQSVAVLNGTPATSSTYRFVFRL